MALSRVTLTLDRKVVEEARMVSGGNFSRYVNRILEEDLEERRRRRLRDELRAGYEAEAEHDLQIAQEFRVVEDEVIRREES